MKIVSQLLILILFSACHHKDVTNTFNNHKFDKQVIQKLPLYDSLANVILTNYPSPQQYNINKTSYRYIPNLDGNDLYKVFSKDAGDKVKHWLSEIGPDLIFGFECFKDSTMRILVRDTYVADDHLSIRERLSFYPSGKNIRRRDYPVKDTILNKNWQYWMVIEEEFFGAN